MSIVIFSNDKWEGLRLRLRREHRGERSGFDDSHAVELEEVTSLRPKEVVVRTNHRS